MKTVTIITIMLAGTLSFGQIEHKGDKKDKLTTEQKAEKKTDKMNELLSLTSDQKEKVYQINLDHIKEMDEIKIEKDALRTKVRSEKDATKSKMDAVLTAEQRVVMEQKHEEMKKKRADKKKNCTKEK